MAFRNANCVNLAVSPRVLWGSHTGDASRSLGCKLCLPGVLSACPIQACESSARQPIVVSLQDFMAQRSNDDEILTKRNWLIKGAHVSKSLLKGAYSSNPY